MFQSHLHAWKDHEADPPGRYDKACVKQGGN